MKTGVKLKFLGGVVGNNFTGSCTLIVIKTGKIITKILIDVGLIQDNFSDSIIQNRKSMERIKASEIDIVILTHAHTDHVGLLPLLVKKGFTGKIICTEATCDLLKYMLEDSAKIQQTEALSLRRKASNKKNEASHENKLTRDQISGKYDQIKNKRKKSKKVDITPLYDLTDVAKVNQLIKNNGYKYHQWIRLSHTVQCKLYNSGHILGGAIIVLKISKEPSDLYICFSGDLGRNDNLILPPPEKVKELVNLFITESTYGGVNHPDRNNDIEKMIDLVKNAWKNNQKIIIPCFALERTQEIIYLLSYLMEKGSIPDMPIYLDSPLASKITSVFSSGWNDGLFTVQKNLKYNPFDPNTNKHLNIINNPEDTNQLIHSTKPSIVIAGSGMCEAGKIRDYLRHNLSNSKTIIWLVGYMAKNTLGNKLKDRPEKVNMNKEEILVKAEIICFDTLSSHVSGNEIVKLAKEILAKSNVDTKIAIIHGNEDRAKCLKSDLENEFFRSEERKIIVLIPKKDEELELN